MQSLHSIKFRSLAAVLIFFGLFFLSLIKLGYTASNQPADDFPSEPILRLETGQHTAMINRIDVDRHQRFVVSGSDDKTVRIWDSKTGHLLRNLRVPIGAGNLGKIYCVAISPDGNSVAVSGWTGAESGLNCDIYIFNRESGTIRHVISGLPKTVTHLTFSLDGKYLAATLGGRIGESNGIRVYETKTYKPVAEDSKYNDSSYWADFDASGRLVTTSWDGYIRLYGKDFSLIQKKQAPGGKKPFSAVFSTNGLNIAVGYDDSTRVDVLSAENLKLRFSANTSETNSDLSTVAWSKDGRYLYAGGGYDVADKNLVRRWSEGGQGSFTEFKVASNTVMDLKPLSNDRLAVGTSDPVIAVLSADGKPIWEHRRDIADFRGQRGSDGIRLSKSGDIVQFGYEIWGESLALFSLKTWQLELNPPEDSRLIKPVTAAPGLKITDWDDKYTPMLNDKPLALRENERSRSLAIAPDHKHFLLGSDWSLRLFDHTGKQLWEVEVPSSAWAVNISGDGKCAVAGYGDGTIRWHRLADGKEFLAFFPCKDGKSWIAWTPQGFYQASAGAEDLIGWHLNLGSKQAPDFYGASRFREQFYRPDVLARVLDTLDVKKALALADKARGTRTVTKDVKSILPPTIRILSPAAGTKTQTNKLVIFYEAESTTGPIIDVKVRIEGRPVKALDQVKVKGEKNAIIGKITVEIPPEDVTISLIAENKHGTSEPTNFRTNWTGSKDWYKPNLYVLAVGVSHYEKKGMNLKYAAKDAQDFAEAIKEQEGGLYKEVSSQLLISTEKIKDATQDKILDGLEWIMRETTSRDVAMVFLSGHGTNDANGNYNFLPRDADPDRLYRTCIDNHIFKRYLGNIPGKTVFFFDSCRSGNIKAGVKASDQLPDVDNFANELADADAGVIVFSSSTGKQFSLEKDELQNGVFTEALIEGIRGLADYSMDWHVTIAELEVYLPERVKELTKGEQKPVSTKPQTVEDFKIVRVRQ